MIKLASLLLIAICWNLAAISGVKASTKSLKEKPPFRATHRFSAAEFTAQAAAYRDKKTEAKLRATRQQKAKLQKKTVLQILTDKVLWGKDFLTVLAYLESFQRVNETRIAVFSDEVVTTTALKSEDEGKRAAEQLNQTIEKLTADPTPLNKNLLLRFDGQRKTLRAEVLPYFAEDESVRVRVDSLDLFSDKLAVETVKKQLGKPEKVSTLLVETEGEMRPLILTLFSYAGGAIVFAEADIAVRPGFINRVYLDVPKILAVLEQEVK